jgi:hypothetical protein
MRTPDQHLQRPHATRVFCGRVFSRDPSSFWLATHPLAKEHKFFQGEFRCLTCHMAPLTVQCRSYRSYRASHLLNTRSKVLLQHKKLRGCQGEALLAVGSRSMAAERQFRNAGETEHLDSWSRDKICTASILRVLRFLASSNGNCCRTSWKNRLTHSWICDDLSRRTKCRPLMLVATGLFSCR